MCGKVLYNLFADWGDWLEKESKNKWSAVILGILSVFSPMGFLFAISFIMSANRKRKKR